MSQPVKRPVPPPPPDHVRPQPQPAYSQQPAPRKRKSRAVQAIAILIVLLLLLMALLYTPLGPMLLGPLTGQKTYAQQSSFTLTRTIELNIARGEINYACDLPVPVDYYALGGIAQDISSVSFSPAASEEVKFGGDWIQWEGTSDSTVQLSMVVRGSARTVVWDIDMTSSGTLADIPASMNYQLGDEWEETDSDGNPTGQYKIWPSSPTIRTLAGTLTSDELTVYENVRAVYDYVRQNIEYQAVSGSDPKSCVDTLSDRTGDCDDQSMLLISICRAAGIPSWLAFGALYDGVRDQWGPHAWAEIYVPMASGGAERPAIDVVNGEYFVRNCNRMEEWKSDGDGNHLDDYYHILTYNYTIFGNQPLPQVVLDESFTGSYESSGALTAWIGLFLVPAEKRE